jgi:hypothetical protein
MLTKRELRELEVIGGALFIQVSQGYPVDLTAAKRELQKLAGRTPTPQELLPALLESFRVKAVREKDRHALSRAHSSEVFFSSTGGVLVDGSRVVDSGLTATGVLIDIEGVRRLLMDQTDLTVEEAREVPLPQQGIEPSSYNFYVSWGDSDQ